ncbi:MAG: uracil-DNA glycosylase family protein [Elusimicrobiota bacterium]
MKNDKTMIINLLSGMVSCSQCSFANKDYPPLAPVYLSGRVKVMFIGENPSWEFGQRIPLDGLTKSGKALHEQYIVPIKKPFNLKESDFWITNLFKCRYPKNVYHEKAKRQAEIFFNARTCANNWLIKEIETVRPEIVVTLGDKAVYQRLRKIFNIASKTSFGDAAYNPQRAQIGNHKCSLLAACHPDISVYTQRKHTSSQKWSKMHSKKFVKSFKKITSAQ